MPRDQVAWEVRTAMTKSDIVAANLSRASDKNQSTSIEGIIGHLTSGLSLLHSSAHIDPRTTVVQSTWSWHIASKLWLKTMSDELECIVAICFRLITIVSQRATVNLVVPKKELVILLVELETQGRRHLTQATNSPRIRNLSGAT